MKKEIKYKFKWGFTWKIEKLEQWMSDMSAKGMQIEKPGFLWNRFRVDHTSSYIYRIDFQQDLTSKDKLNEYISLFSDGGWEYIGSVGPLWHYFRKSALSQEPHELYTDRASLVDYYKRIRKALLVIALVNLMSLIIDASIIFPKYHSSNLWSILIPVVSIQILLLFSLIYGYLKFGQKIKHSFGDK